MTKEFRELKFSNIKFILLPFFAFLLFSINAPLLNKTQAQATNCPISGPNPRAEGLITTPGTVAGLDNPSGTCIINDAAAEIFLDRAKITNVQTYTDLKNTYFTKARVTSPAQKKYNHNAFTPPSGDALYEVTGNLTAGGTYDPPVFTGIGTQIYFIDGNLTIDNNLIYSNPNGGIVFVVQGNINIYSGVTRVDAVLIAQGVDASGLSIPPSGQNTPYTICTNYESNNCADPTTTSSQLVVNGSLISLNKDQTTTPSSIKFKRTLADNTQPAEKVNAQPKYLIILKGLMSSDLLVPISAK